MIHFIIRPNTNRIRIAETQFSNIRLSPAERHTNSNFLECLAHGRACLLGFRLQQASGGRAATIIRIRCMHDYSAEYKYTIRPTIRTE